MHASNQVHGVSCTGFQPALSIAFFMLILGVLTVGIGCNEPAPGKLTGVVSMNGDPVFPGVVMLRSTSGKGLSANLSNEGKFTAFGVEAGEKYSVAIETIKLAGVSRVAKPSSNSNANSESGSVPLRREDTIPEKFQNANIDIPRKFSSFDTSGLIIDCTDGLPVDPVVLHLE